MRRVIKKIVQSAADVVRLRIDTSKWDFALVSFEAQGAAGSALVLAPGSYAADNFTGAPAAPAQDAAVHTSIGPGCRIPDPLPEQLDVGLTATGGNVSITVELSRHELEENNDQVSALADFRKLGESIVTKLEDLIIEARSR